MFNQPKSWLVRISGPFLLFLTLSGIGVQGTDDKSALRRGTSSIWADVDTEGARFDGSPLSRSDVEDRSKWVYFPRQNAPTPTSPTTATPTYSSNSLEILGEILYYTFWTVVVLALIGPAVWLVYKQDFFLLFKRRHKNKTTEDIAAQLAKISDLPIDIESPISGLKAQAELLRNRGDYSKAIVYLFGYLLVELDSNGCLQLAKGKTNYQYLREVSNHPEIRRHLRKVVQLFEEAYFGRRTLTQEQFDSVWYTLPEFEELIAKASQKLDRAAPTVRSEIPIVIGGQP